MNIAFDVDGVVLNSIDIILEYINRVKGKKLTTEDLLSWELEKLDLEVKTLWDAVDYMYVQPWIEPYEGALDVLSWIHRETEKPLLFITGRRDPASALRQLRAADWNPAVPEMIVTGGERNKLTYIRENSVDFIVEDDAEHLQQYLDAGVGVGLMLRPWNSRTKIPVTRKFSGWGDLKQWFIGNERSA